MPHGCLSNTLHEVLGDVAAWPLRGSGAHRTSHYGVTSFLETSSTLQPHQLMPHRLRGGTHLGASFMTAPDPAAEDEAEAAAEISKETEAGDAEAPAEGKNEHHEDDPFPTWANTKGLPTVMNTAKSDNYFSPDIATGAGDGTFKPVFGCKCGDPQPAPTHPMIQFRETFIQGHPTFTQRLRKLKVHMEDTTANKVHWDATYDLRRFLTADNLAKASQPGGSLKLTDTMPAEKGGGTQLRFMTFCPPAATAGAAPAPHEYTLKVTALDEDEQPIDGFVDDVSRYSATPAAPEPAPGPEAILPSEAAAQAEQEQLPIVGTAKVA